MHDCEKWERDAAIALRSRVAYLEASLALADALADRLDRRELVVPQHDHGTCLHVRRRTIELIVLGFTP